MNNHKIEIFWISWFFSQCVGHMVWLLLSDHLFSVSSLFFICLIFFFFWSTDPCMLKWPWKKEMLLCRTFYFISSIHFASKKLPAFCFQRYHWFLASQTIHVTQILIRWINYGFVLFHIVTLSINPITCCTRLLQFPLQMPIYLFILMITALLDTI